MSVTPNAPQPSPAPAPAPRPHPPCFICGYDLRGSGRTDLCPECGTPAAWSRTSILSDAVARSSLARTVSRVFAGLAFLAAALAWFHVRQTREVNAALFADFKLKVPLLTQIVSHPAFEWSLFALAAALAIKEVLIRNHLRTLVISGVGTGLVMVMMAAYHYGFLHPLLELIKGVS